MTDPWLRTDNESEKAFHAFVIYRDLRENRSYQEVSKKVGKNRKLIERWSKQHDWTNRAIAFDRYEDSQRICVTHEKLLEMYRNHCEVGRTILERVAKELSLLPLGTLTPRDIAALAKIGSEIEEKGMICANPDLFKINDPVERPPIKYIEFREQRRKIEDTVVVTNANNNENSSE